MLNLEDTSGFKPKSVLQHSLFCGCSSHWAWESPCLRRVSPLHHMPI